MGRLPQQTRGCVIATVFASSVMTAGATAQGQDLFQNLVKALGLGGRAEPAVEVVVEAAPEAVANEPFVPPIKTLLATELHFVQKVCQPNDAEMDEIRRAGLVEVERLAKRFAAAQAQNRRDSLPDARSELAEALWNKILEVMPTKAAERYSDELTAREEARKQAAAEMMTTLVDRKLTLTPKQFDEVAKATLDNWQDAWGRDLQIYLYDDYAPSPDAKTIEGVLTERQKQLWGSGGNRNGRIVFGWEHELGLDWGGPQQLGQELLVEKPDSKPDNTTKSSEGTEPAGDQRR